MPAWLTDYELEACRRVADELDGQPDPEEFLRQVVREAEARVNLTQPEEDLSHFTISDLTEDDRKELLELGGFDTETPEILDVITEMPRHTIVSDGTAKRIAETTLAAVLGPSSDFSDLRLFAETGAVVEGLRDLVVEMQHQTPAGRRQDDLERLARYLEHEDPRGPLSEWATLEVPGWADRLPSPAYLAGADTPAPELAPDLAPELEP